MSLLPRRAATLTLVLLVFVGAPTARAQNYYLPPGPQLGVAGVESPQLAEGIPPAAPQAAAQPAPQLPAGTLPATAFIPEQVPIIPPTAETPAGPEFYWYQPRHWFDPSWNGGLEVGINGSEGNAQAFSLRVGANLKQETKTYLWSLDVSHAKTTADSLVTQNNALGKTRLDRFLGDSPLSMFLDGALEYDEFKAFDLRLATHGGLGYSFVRTAATKLIGRFGSGVSHELGGPDDDYVPEATFGLELTHQISSRQRLTLKTEYLPDWNDFADYRLLSDASWEVLLDEATNLSLKVGAIDRYDSTPEGRRPNDVDYLLLLIWKL